MAVVQLGQLVGRHGGQRGQVDMAGRTARPAAFLGAGSSQFLGSCGLGLFLDTQLAASI